jgi:FAD binding domain
MALLCINVSTSIAMPRAFRPCRRCRVHCKPDQAWYVDSFKLKTTPGSNAYERGSESLMTSTFRTLVSRSRTLPSCATRKHRARADGERWPGKQLPGGNPRSLFRKHPSSVARTGRTRRGRSMTGLIERMLRRLDGQLPGRISKPGDNRYVAATALWAKPIGRMPRAVAHCRTPQDVQSAIRAARDCDLPLSVRGGGHDWAGRALCDGLVIDLSGMNEVVVGTDRRTARISGGARAADVVAIGPDQGATASPVGPGRSAGVRCDGASRWISEPPRRR